MTKPTFESTVSESSPLSRRELARMIDISAVQAFHTEQDVRSLARLALENGFIAAHALPHFVPVLRSLIPMGGSTLVGGPVGFPSGGHTTMIKLAEARSLVEAGAEEVD
jgi:deoxyribose-phosphate aldolase